MRVIRIDPETQTIEDLQISPTLEGFQALLDEGYIVGHYVVPMTIPDHMCYVNEEGIRKGLKTWHFAGCVIWGPMIILGASEHDARVSLEQVRPHVKF